MLPRYREWNDNTAYLELHSNHTAWSLDNEYATDDDWYNVVESTIELLAEVIGTPVYLLGRGGRHVCIEDTVRNRLNYWTWRRYALLYEQDAINEYNSIPCDE